jgi:chorismate mutase
MFVSTAAAHELSLVPCPPQPPVLPPLTYAHSPLPSYADEINMNEAVMAAYCGPVLDAVTEDGDDHNYGSSALNDVACLQALSKRIHFGKFVAEAKYRENGAVFDAAIAAGDAAAILAALTYPQQEAAVAARVARKAAAMGASVAEVEPGASCRVTPEAAARLWVDVVMPLTKQVQVAYLLRRGEAREAPGQPGRFAQGQARGTGPPGGFI